MEARIIHIIFIEGEVNITYLSESFNVKPATMSERVNSMVEKGWLERFKSKDDRRVTKVKLAEKAKKRIHGLYDRKMKSFEWILDSLSEIEMRSLFSILRKIESTIKEKI